MNLTGDGKSILVVDDCLRLAGIPADSHRYEVNGRTSFVWIIDRYRIPKNCPSGILKDPNVWFPDEDAFISVVQGIVYLSVETVHIVEGLPKVLEES